MHICVIGDGVAGLMSANFFASKNYIHKITLVGSSKIPTIGVGESTTLNFETLHRFFDEDFDSFIRESDACVKLGVLYSNWSKKEFLHHFKMPNLYEKYNITAAQYSNYLGNKNPDTYIHDLVGNKLVKDAKDNLIPDYNINNLYGRSWHFDAGKYISYLKKLTQNNHKINIIDDTVIQCDFSEDEVINFIKLESNIEIEADYFIICTGHNAHTSKIFNIKYKSIDDILLTNKALFFPKKYTNKKKEFHPYTIAKTMKNGWRWITPTWSRVGTGYVFSTNHITVEEAIQEFQDDIGDNTIIPNVVDFHPKYSQQTFNKNYMTLGMCNGFLEPLDAPGLAISCALTMLLGTILSQEKNVYDIKNKNYKENYWNNFNNFVEEMYNGWAAFILAQYKTSHRCDTQFWIDHKNVEFDYLSDLMENLNNEETRLQVCDVDDPKPIINSIKKDIKMMIQQTISSRNIQWNTNNKTIPFKLDDSDYDSINHYDFIESKHI